MVRKFLIGLLYVPLIIMIINHFSAEKNPGDIPSQASNQSDGAVVGSHSGDYPTGVYGDSNGQWVGANSTNEFSFHINPEWRDNFPVKKEISTKHTHKTIFTLGWNHPDNGMYSAKSRRHHMLVNFYENPRRYSEGFEKIYKIFEKYNVPHNT